MQEKKKLYFKNWQRARREKETAEETTRRKEKDRNSKRQRRGAESENEKRARREHDAESKRRKRKKIQLSRSSKQTAKNAQADGFQQESQCISKDLICRICRVAKVDSHYIPCGHSFSCLTCAKKWFLNSSSNCPFCNQEVKVLTAWESKKRIIIPSRKQRCEDDVEPAQFDSKEFSIECCVVCGKEESKEDMSVCPFCDCFTHEECETKHNCQSESEHSSSDSEFAASCSASALCADAEDNEEPARKKRKLTFQNFNNLLFQ